MNAPDLYISKSAIEAYLRCHALYHFRYPLGARPLGRKPAPMVMGNVQHAGFNEGFLGRHGDLECMLHHMESHPDWDHLTKANQLISEAVLTAAHSVFQPFRDAVEVEYAEVKLARDDEHVFLNQVGDDETCLVRYSVTCDAAVSEGDDRYLFELKTKQKAPWGNDWDRAEVSLQKQMFVTEMEEYHDFSSSGVWWQFFVQPMQKKYAPPTNGKGEVEWLRRTVDMMATDSDDWFPKRFFKRHATLEKNAKRDLTRLVDMLIYEMQRGPEYAQNRNSCFDFKRKCDFYNVCHKDPRLINDKKLFQLRKDR